MKKRYVFFLFLIAAHSSIAVSPNSNSAFYTKCIEQKSGAAYSTIELDLNFNPEGEFNCAEPSDDRAVYCNFSLRGDITLITLKKKKYNLKNYQALATVQFLGDFGEAGKPNVVYQYNIELKADISEPDVFTGNIHVRGHDHGYYTNSPLDSGFQMTFPRYARAFHYDKKGNTIADTGSLNFDGCSSGINAGKLDTMIGLMLDELEAKMYKQSQGL